MDRAQFENEYYAGLTACGERYTEMLADFVMKNPMRSATSEDIKALRSFLPEFCDNVNRRQPLLKMNRWLGYIQRDIILLGCTTVQAELDWTRPLFRPLDFASIE